MTQPFVLQLTDNIETIDFLSYLIALADGGFDIGQARVDRSLGLIRPGVYAPVSNNYEYRESKIKFHLYGANRAELIASIQKIERVLKNISARSVATLGRRGELSYTWEGSDSITYFEVYGGDISFPADLLSAEKIHASSSRGAVMLPDCEITLQLSAYGYGISIYTDVLDEVPLYNPSVGSPTTGGVKIQNIWSSTPSLSTQYNYVDIAADALPGSQPLVTKLVLSTDTPYSGWDQIYVGVKHNPTGAYPSGFKFDYSALYTSYPGSTVYDAGGTLCLQMPIASNHNSPEATFSWKLPSTFPPGMYYVFLHSALKVATSALAFSGGSEDLLTSGLVYRTDFVYPLAGIYTLPLGVLQLPNVNPELVAAGSLTQDQNLGVWVVNNSDQPVGYYLNYASVLPVDNGLRIWVARFRSGTAGQYVDDGWKGLEYFKRGSDSALSTPFYPLLDSLRLEPGVSQRLSFASCGQPGGVADEIQRAFKVRLFVVPTYLALAM